MLTMMNAKHSGHSASDSPAAHPSQRQLSAEAVDEARQAFRDGRSPKEVLELMRTRYNEAITAQDVYNLKAKITRANQKAAATAAAAVAVETKQQTPDPTTDPMLQIQMVPPTNGVTEVEACACQCCHH